MKTIRDFDLNNKKVIIRVDFNVPMKDGVILDDNRIKSSLDTIKYAIEKNAKVILLSHLGRIKTVEDKDNNSLKPVSIRLSELLNKNVLFIPETRGKQLEDAIDNMKSKDVILVENTRYEDLNEKAESSNNEELGRYWASLGDIFINDAFATSHRSHASNVGISTYLPSGIGFLIERELKALDLENADRPLTIILGGAKVSDKIGLINNLALKADNILIGGGMAYTFIKACDINIGQSLLDKDNIEFAKDMLKKYKDKIVLPIDSVNRDSKGNIRTCFINEIKEDETGLDIGIQTIKLFKNYLLDSKTIIWNGPVGYFEEKPFDNGTKEICNILKNIDAKKIAGGGDTASAVINLGYKDVFTHISTGGGASLELLEGKKLPGVIYEKENY